MKLGGSLFYIFSVPAAFDFRSLRQGWQDKDNAPRVNASTLPGAGSIHVTPISKAPLGTVVSDQKFSSALSAEGSSSSELSLALASGCVNTGANIQLAIDSAYALGGGTVYLPPGVYCIDQPLIVKSKVYLIGAGVGSTILRGKSGTYISGNLVDGAEVYATVAAVGADTVSIRDVTVEVPGRDSLHPRHQGAANPHAP